MAWDCRDGMVCNEFFICVSASLREKNIGLKSWRMGRKGGKAERENGISYLVLINA